MTGVPADVAVIRIQNALSGVDQWSATEMSKLLLIQMQSMTELFQREFERTLDPKMAEVLTKNVKAVSDHYMKMRELAIKEEGLIGEQQRQLLRLFMEMAYVPVREWVADTFDARPDQLTEMDKIFVEAMKDKNNETR